MQHLAMGIRDHLDFDVTRPLQIFLHVNGVVAERGFCLGARGGNSQRMIGGMFRWDWLAGGAPLHSDSSASRTCSESASAVEWIATVAMRISLQARLTRSAISPRFAISSFSNIAGQPELDMMCDNLTRSASKARRIRPAANHGRKSPRPGRQRAMAPGSLSSWLR